MLFEKICFKKNSIPVRNLNLRPSEHRIALPTKPDELKNSIKIDLIVEKHGRETSNFISRFFSHILRAVYVVWESNAERKALST